MIAELIDHGKGSARQSIMLVAEYMIGTLTLTDFDMLTSQERYCFSPRGHTADWLMCLWEQYCMDMMTLETRDKR